MLGGEGLLAMLSHGNCTLGPVSRRLGDDKAFFELLLPVRDAALAVPVLAAITALGAILLAVRRCKPRFADRGRQNHRLRQCPE